MLYKGLDKKSEQRTVIHPCSNQSQDNLNPIMKLLKLVIEKFSGDISLLKRLLEFEAIDRNLNLSKADKFNYLKSPFLWALLPDPL